MPPRDPSQTAPELRVFLCDRRPNDVCFRAVRAITRGRVQARAALMCPSTRRQLRRSRGVSHTLPERVRLCSAERRHHLCRAHVTGEVEDDTAEGHNDSGVSFSHSRARRTQRWRKRRRQRQTPHSRQGVRTSRPRHWPKRRVIRSPVVGLCSYSRTTIGRRCPAATIALGCRAICSSSRC